jgi:hexosaminidase
MRSLDLPDAHALQSWFMSRMIQYLASQGKSAIGWDEILEGGLPEGAAVMSWRGTEGGKAAARAGHSVVMSPGKPCYLDHYQHDGPEEPLAIGGMNRLEDVYTYEPVPADLEPGAVVWIQGAQGNVWTEYMTSWDKVEYMVMPRMTALAEVLWSPALNRTVGRGRTYEHYRDRLRSHAGWMARQGLHFAPHGWDPTVLPERPSN